LPANKTIADGIAVRCAGTLTFSAGPQKYVGPKNRDGSMKKKIGQRHSLQLLEKRGRKRFAEGAGAAATAAVL